MTFVPRTAQAYRLVELGANNIETDQDGQEGPTSFFRFHRFGERILGSTFVPCYMWDLTVPGAPRNLGEMRYEKPAGSTGEIHSSVELDGILWLFAYSTGTPIWSYDGKTFTAHSFPGNNWNWRCRGLGTNGTLIWVSGEHPTKTSLITQWDPATLTATEFENVAVGEFTVLKYHDGVLYGVENALDPAVAPPTLHALDPANMNILWSVTLIGAGEGLSMEVRDGLILVLWVSVATTRLAAVDPNTEAIVWTHSWNMLSNGALRNSFAWFNDTLWFMTNNYVGQLSNRVTFSAGIEVPAFVDLPSPLALAPNDEGLVFGSDNIAYLMTTYDGEP